MGRFFRHPALWGILFLIWVAVLWWLSSGVREFPDALQFEFSDKVIHFGYFFGGSGLFSAFIHCLARPSRNARLANWSWPKRIALSVAAIALVGASDEFHQSFVQGRSGNDPFDLAADILGALAGALVFRFCSRVLNEPTGFRSTVMNALPGKQG